MSCISQARIFFLCIHTFSRESSYDEQAFISLPQLSSHLIIHGLDYITGIHFVLPTPRTSPQIKPCFIPNSTLNWPGIIHLKLFLSPQISCLAHVLPIWFMTCPHGSWVVYLVLELVHELSPWFLSCSSHSWVSHLVHELPIWCMSQLLGWWLVPMVNELSQLFMCCLHCKWVTPLVHELSCLVHKSSQ